MILALTATRLGLTQAQKETAARFFADDLPDLVLHGGAKGGDAQLHAILRPLYKAPCPIEVYPADPARWTFWNYASANGTIFRVHPSTPPLVRNRAMALRCDRLLACPDGPERRHSGTWTTVRYAREAGKPVAIITPDGALLEEAR